MKKIFLIVLALFMCHTVFSQFMMRVKPEATNDIKVNLAMLLGSLPEISYERVWANNLGLGASLRFALSDTYDTKFQITPYCRFYYGESSIKSFFTEINLAVQSYSTLGYSIDPYTSSTKNDVDLGIGLAVGYRYVNRSGLISEIFLGLGRTVNDRIYSRCGVSIGKVF